MKSTRASILFLTLTLVAACGQGEPPDENSQREAPGPGARVDDIAEQYVRLALELGARDEHYVDAYFGPADWREAAADEPSSLESLHDRARRLQQSLRELPPVDDGLAMRRREGLSARLESLAARVEILQDKGLSFDEEARRIYGVAPPDYGMARFRAVRERIDELVPGEDSLAGRVNAFRERFVIPEEAIAPVFEAAIRECRERTIRHLALPEGESFTVEYVRDKPWTGYNWYKGDAYSLIQVNVGLPLYIDRAVDLGCHEGYPGHHTYNSLLEANLLEDEGWIEFAIYPLFSPQSLIAEGSANFGIDLAFPGEERVRFEKAALFPEAGLDPAGADRYYRLQALMEELSYVGNEVARDYLNGDIEREEGVRRLMHYALNTEEKARQRMDFIDTYRAYVINYNYGQDLVADWVRARAGNDPEKRWDVFRRLLSSPIGPQDLAAELDRDPQTDEEQESENQEPEFLGSEVPQ